MRRRWLLIAGAAALANCSVLPQAPYVERRDWPLDIRRPSVAPPNMRGRILLVRSIRASPGLEARGLQSLQQDGSLDIDFYEQWAVPPAQAIEDALRQWLADSGRFKAVVAPGSRLTADFVLEGELTAFVADLRSNTARASLALVLLDQRQGAARVLMQKTITAEVPLADKMAPAIAAGLKAAMVEVLRRAETDVAAAAR